MRLRRAITRQQNYHFLEFSDEEAAEILTGKNKRVIIGINGETFVHRKMSPRKSGGHFVMIGKGVMSKAGIEVGQELNLEVVEDTTEHQFEMPIALSEVLETDPDAHRAFKALTPGRKRGLMHMVGSLKSTDKQIEKALLIAENIKLGITDPRQFVK